MTKVIRPEDLHTSDFTIEGNKVRVLKEYNWYMAEYAVDPFQVSYFFSNVTVAPAAIERVVGDVL